MAFQVTKVTTKADISAPNLTEWLNSLPDDYLAADYPTTAGQTPSEFVSDFVTNEVYTPSKGFISEENASSEDKSVWTSVTLWDSQADYEADLANGSKDTQPITGTVSASNTSATVTGTGTAFTTDLFVGANLTAGFDNLSTAYIGVVESIESDTSLTLVAASANNMPDKAIYVMNDDGDAYEFLLTTYNNDVSTANVVTTFANV